MSEQRHLSESEAELEMLREHIRSVPCPPEPKGCGAAVEQPCTRLNWRTNRREPRHGLECAARVIKALGEPS